MIKITPQNIFQVSCTCFSVIVVISNILSAKMVLLPLISISIPAGLLFYPITFLITDLITEVFGSKKAKQMVYLALGMNLLSLALIQLTLLMPGNGLEEEKAFQLVLGLTGVRIFSSLVAYITSQIVDIQLYVLIKKWTGSKYLWLRNNGSTCISQLVDTLIIDIIFLWWGLQMSITEILPIMTFSYLYKALFSVICTPLFYFFVFWFRKKKPLETTLRDEKESAMQELTVL